MAEIDPWYRPTPLALLLMAVLVLLGLVLVKKQRWHSPCREIQPTPVTRPREVGPAKDELRADLLRQAPMIRVLLRSSSLPLEVDAEGYPGVVQVVQDGDEYLRVCLVDLETYVAHVVTGELPDAWDTAVKAAQAVAARSYAMTELTPDRPYDIKASALAQNFRREATDPGALDAAAATRGVVLRQGERVVRAFYHSTCGGRTTSPLELWGMVRPVIEPVPCEHCAGSPLRRWSYETSLDELSRQLGSTVRDAWVETNDSTGRADRVAVETADGLQTFRGEEFRTAVGFTHLRSTWFVVERDGEAVRFLGRGSGHGVGMCQWGARSMSQAGHTWQEILQFYYPGMSIGEMY